MHFNLAVTERTVAAIGSVIVFVVALVALKNDWKTPGLENQIFKLMLALLALGGIIAFFAGIGVLGNFGKVA